MKTTSLDPHSLHEKAVRTFHEYTVRGAYPVILGYPQDPDVLRLSRQIKDSCVAGSIGDCHQIPDYRAYIVIAHPSYREQIVRQLIETLHNLHPDSFIIHKELFSSEQFAHKAA